MSDNLKEDLQKLSEKLERLSAVYSGPDDITLIQLKDRLAERKLALIDAILDARSEDYKSAMKGLKEAIKAIGEAIKEIEAIPSAINKFGDTINKCNEVAKLVDKVLEAVAEKTKKA